ncbi:MAG TPA: PspC domain-containing protein [bacterium]|nr:PspC domain-containing protein [bacterium]
MSSLRLAPKKKTKILGVCGGLATFFDISPTLLRILCVVGIFFSFGTILIIYLLLYLIMPKG